VLLAAALAGSAEGTSAAGGRDRSIPRDAGTGLIARRMAPDIPRDPRHGFADPGVNPRGGARPGGREMADAMARVRGWAAWARAGSGGTACSGPAAWRCSLRVLGLVLLPPAAPARRAPGAMLQREVSVAVAPTLALSSPSRVPREAPRRPPSWDRSAIPTLIARPRKPGSGHLLERPFVELVLFRGDHEPRPAHPRLRGPREGSRAREAGAPLDVRRRSAGHPGGERRLPGRVAATDLPDHARADERQRPVLPHPRRQPQPLLLLREDRVRRGLLLERHLPSTRP
jgi:hypothetical protein